WFWPRTAPPPPPPPSAASGRWLAAAPQTIPIGQDPRLIAVADDGASLAISDGQSGLVTVLDPRTFALRARLAASSAVAAMTWAHGRLYAAVQDASQLEVFDPARPSSVAVVPLPAPASDLALLPDQNRLYLALTYAGLAWLDLADSSLHRISTPPCPARLALGPSHKRLYVAFQCGGLGGSHGHDAVGVLDLATNTLTARFGGPPQVGTALAISPDASQAWVSQGDVCVAPQYDHTGCQPGQRSGINLFNLGDNRFLKNLPLSASPGAIAFLADGSRAFVSGGDLSVMDANRGSVLERLAGLDARSLALSPGQRRLYAVLAGSHSVAVFTATRSQCAPPAANLISWWPGDGSADDGWGLNHGVLERGAGFTPGRIGQALRASGEAQVRIPRDQSLLAQSPFGLAFWLRLQPVSTATLLASKSAGASGWQILERSDGRVEFRTGTSALVSPRSVLGGWHHL